MASEETLPASRRPDVPDDKIVLYVLKATSTNGAHVVKPLMLLEALSIPYAIHVVSSAQSETWFHALSPQKLVPAMEDVEVRDGKRLSVWESSACLTFLVDKYDKAGEFGGRDLWERTQVGNWLTLHTAALGATAKWWLWFKVFHPDEVGSTLDFLLANIKEQYRILERRLSEPGQNYIALPDRPTIADFANLPFANEKIAASASIDFAEFTKLKAWSEDMFTRPAVARAWGKLAGFGNE
ncbi:MAG: hypothetical protein M1830_000722 [Pleopsidium flavum]|nr:MAG: hypothetical protein M1830_000722 [Pleopsidium flavum]